MVQMERVFLSLKPPVAVIKHLLLIKIPPVLFPDVQGYMLWWLYGMEGPLTSISLAYFVHCCTGIAFIAHHIHHINLKYRIRFSCMLILHLGWHEEGSRANSCRRQLFSKWNSFPPSIHCSLLSHLDRCPRPWSRRCRNYTPALCGGRKPLCGCSPG